MRRIKFLIVGAGPTGLGAAYRLKELGENNFRLVEQSEHCGGLASSFKDQNGFTWDIGGHVQFSHYPYFDQAMETAIPQEGWLHHQRESWVWIRGRFVPYPFQNNIGFLPKEPMWNCLNGLIDVSLNEFGEHPHNFRDWILASFGKGIAEEFMLPYNYKVWAYPPEQLSYQWIGERVATVDLRRIIHNILFSKLDASWGPNNTFRFPLEGGTGAVWRSIGNYVGLDKIQFRASLQFVDPVKRRAQLSTGEVVFYEQLLSTVPVDLLAGMVKGIPGSLRRRAKQLKHSTSNVIGLGIKGRPHDLLAKKCWMYFPEDTVPFYRMTVFSNYSGRNVPDPERYYSLMCEVSESPAKPVRRENLIDETVRGVFRNGLLPEDNEVVSRWLFTAEYGYPTPSLERDAVLRDVIPPLDELGVFSRGRFGGWKYEVSNQDHCFMQGVEWVNRLLKAEEETTFRVDVERDPNLTVLKKAV